MSYKEGAISAGNNWTELYCSAFPFFFTLHQYQNLLLLKNSAKQGFEGEISANIDSFCSEIYLAVVCFLNIFKDGLFLKSIRILLKNMLYFQ